MSDPRALSIIRDDLRLPDERPFGSAWADFQRDDFEAILDPSAPPNAWLARPRGGSKTGDLGAVAVTDLLTGPDHAQLFAVAADQDQARLLHESVESWCLSSPALEDSFEITRNEVLNPVTRARLRVVASDAPSAYGLRPYRAYLDEITSWPSRAMFDALATAMHKVPGARMYVASTAGSPNHWSFPLWQHANSSPLWLALEHHELAPWTDAAQIEDMRRHLPASVLARQIENRWAAGDESLFTAEEVEAATDFERGAAQHGDGGHEYVIGVDLGVKHDATAIVVLERGRKEVHRVLHLWTRQGSPSSPVQLGEVEDKIRDLQRRFRPAEVYVDPYQMVGSVQRLDGAVFEWPFTAQSVAKASSKLLSLIREGRLRLLPDERLRAELLSLVVKETSYGWRMEAAPGAHDDVAMALAVAACEVDAPFTGSDVWEMGDNPWTIEPALGELRAALTRSGNSW